MIKEFPVRLRSAGGHCNSWVAPTWNRGELSMPSLQMNGPHLLNRATIDLVVKYRVPGNYALGWVSKKGLFIVRYVGRSDTDLNQELKARMNPTYMHFKYSYAASSRVAFEKECRNFHDFGGTIELENLVHPDRPDGTSLVCRVCVKRQTSSVVSRTGGTIRLPKPPMLVSRLPGTGGTVAVPRPRERGQN
jgi:hypothetical protein